MYVYRVYFLKAAAVFIDYFRWKAIFMKMPSRWPYSIEMIISETTAVMMEPDICAIDSKFCSAGEFLAANYQHRVRITCHEL